MRQHGQAHRQRERGEQIDGGEDRNPGGMELVSDALGLLSTSLIV
jgi:hypothetical protein